MPQGYALAGSGVAFLCLAGLLLLSRPLPELVEHERLRVLGQLVSNQGSAPEWIPLLIDLAGKTASYAVRFSDSRDAARRLIDLADPGPR